MIQTASLFPAPVQTRSSIAQNGRTTGDFAGSFAQVNDTSEAELPTLPTSPTLKIAAIAPSPALDTAILLIAALDPESRQDAAATGNALPTTTLAAPPAMPWRPETAPAPGPTLAVSKASLIAAYAPTPVTDDAAPADNMPRSVAIATAGVRLAQPAAFVGVRRNPGDKPRSAANEDPNAPTDDPADTATADASSVVADGMRTFPSAPEAEAEAETEPAPAVLGPFLPVHAADTPAADHQASRVLGLSTPSGQPDIPGALANVTMPDAPPPTGIAGKAALPVPTTPGATPAGLKPDETTARAIRQAIRSGPYAAQAVARDPTQALPAQDWSPPVPPASLVSALPTQPALPPPVGQTLAGLTSPPMPGLDLVASTGFTAPADMTLASADPNVAMPRWTATESTTPVTMATGLPPAVQPRPGTVASASQIFGAAIQAATKARDDIDKADSDGTSAPVIAPAPALAIRTANAQQTALDMRQERWPHAMIERIDMLRDAANATDTRIRLIPDALGAIDVSMRKDGETVHVQFNAEQAATRSLLADAQPRLAELAEARGLKLGQSAPGGGSAGGNTGSGQQRAPATANSPNRATLASAVIADATEDTRIA